MLISRAATFCYGKQRFITFFFFFKDRIIISIFNPFLPPGQGCAPAQVFTPQLLREFPLSGLSEPLGEAGMSLSASLEAAPCPQEAPSPA